MLRREQLQIAIQVIQTTWTKASRGGQGAERRNAVPDAYSLPLPDQRKVSPQPQYARHQLRCAECEEFRPTPQQLVTDEMRGTLIIDRLSIHPPDSADILRVTYQPRRPAHLTYARDQSGEYRPGGQEALALRLGEWGQIRYNWRHHTLYDGDWWYDLWVVNVGYFTELHTDAFLGDAPSKVYSQLSRLR